MSASPQRVSIDEPEDAPLLFSPETETYPVESPTKPSKPWVLLVVLAFCLIAAVDIGSFLADPPRTRVYEANICHTYYKKIDPSKIVDGVVEEELCKVDEVQQKMAMIMGWQELFDAIPGILLAVPYGTMADKYGRKWIFVLSLLGLQLSSCWQLLICYFRTLPLQLTWFSSVFYIIGGGPIVAGAIGITMLSDIVPPEKRTNVFLYLTASVLVGELIAPIMAAILMQYGDWLPLLLALAIQAAGSLLGFFFPETLHLRDLPEPAEDEDFELNPPVKGYGFTWKAQIMHFRDVIRFLKRDATLTLVVMTFFGNRLGLQSMSLIIRYASKRYGWKIQKAAFLTSVRAATSLFALLVVVPLVNYFLRSRRHLSTHKADLWIARGSIVLITFSFLVMGTAFSPVLLILGILIFNLGSGYSASMRSTAVYVVGGQSSPDLARMFAVIAVMEGFGVMISGPVLSSMFQLGIKLGQTFYGIPFIVSFVIFCIITILTYMINIRDAVAAHEEAATAPHVLDEDEPHGRTSALE